MFIIGLISGLVSGVLSGVMLTSVIAAIHFNERPKRNDKDKKKGDKNE